MTAPRRPPHPRPRRALAIAIAATLAMSVSPATAGIRDMVKSAKDKAAGQKAAEPARKSGSAIEFDDTMIELTGEVLDRLIAARKAAQPLLKDRPALVKRRDEIPNELNALLEKHGSEMSENDNQRSTVAGCMATELEAIRKQRLEAEMQRIMANPRSAEKLLKLTVAMNDAQLKGDTATVARVNREIEEMYAPTRADTLAVTKACGPLPAIHPAQLKKDALDQEWAEVDQKLRDLEAKALTLQSEKCEIPEGQLAMAWERIDLYLQKVKYSPHPGGLSATELQALAARKPALEAALAL